MKNVSFQNVFSRQTCSCFLWIATIFVTACSSSKWSEVAKEPDGTVYVDHSMTEKSGTRVTLVYLLDLSTSTAIGVDKKFTYRSSVNIHQYDCSESKSRSLRTDFFDGAMGSGSNVNSIRTDIWVTRNFNNGSLEALWKVACR